MYGLVSVIHHSAVLFSIGTIVLLDLRILGVTRRHGMSDVVLAACRWLESTSWAVTIRESALAYPVMQWIHFIGLSLWLGACLTVDLRLIGIGRRRQTAAELSNGLRAWKWIGFGVAFV